MKIGRDLRLERGKKKWGARKIAGWFFECGRFVDVLTKTAPKIFRVSQTPETTKPRIAGLRDMVRHQESNPGATDYKPFALRLRPASSSITCFAWSRVYVVCSQFGVFLCFTC